MLEHINTEDEAIELVSSNKQILNVLAPRLIMDYKGEMTNTLLEVLLKADSCKYTNKLMFGNLVVSKQNLQRIRELQLPYLEEVSMDYSSYKQLNTWTRHKVTLYNAVDFDHRFINESVRELNLYGGDEVNIATLPRGLTKLEIHHNQFTGTPDLTQLPPMLTHLSLYENQFMGTPDLTQLPPMLTHLDLDMNQFTGTPDLTQLPQVLTHLHLYENQFTGTPDLTQIPQTLTHLLLTNNRFT